MVWHSRPKTTKIQKRNGCSYVYQVVEQVYNPDKKYVVDKRKLIGKMIDDQYMIPNEDFSKFYPEINVEEEVPEFSDTLKIGAYLVIQKLFNDLQIKDLLSSICDKNWKLIVDLVSYMITNESSTFQHYPNFARNHPILEDTIKDDTQISKFLKNGINSYDINLFLESWSTVNKNNECIYIGYDSTNINTYSNGIELADYGHPKVDEGLPQINLSYAVKQADSTPLFYELYDGSITDVAQFSSMIETAKLFGFEKIGFLLDRGYISERNVNFMRNNGYEFILMLKSNQKICQEIIKENGALLKSLEGFYLPNHGVYGHTIQTNLYGKKTYMHIYYDDVRASSEKVALLNKYAKAEAELGEKVAKLTCTKGDVEKYEGPFNLHFDMNDYFQSFDRNTHYIKNELNKLGFFFIATSEEMSAEKALDVYRSRDNKEKMFRSLKSGIDFNKAYIHSTESLKSKVFITFIA